MAETGFVVWFNTQRGYGFIQGDDQKEYFVHWSGINGEGYRSLDANSRVIFDTEPDPRGLHAVNVSVIVESV